jgi:hypothetical protein
MSKLKELNKTQPYMTTTCQIVFSNKFNPLEVYDMLFNDETLRALFESRWVLCRIGEYPMSRYDYDRFITKFDRPFVFMDTIVEMDHTYQGNITVPTHYEPMFRSLEHPVIHPVVISNAESMTGFRIAYFVVYDRSELISTNIYSGKWWDYGKEDKNET